MSPTAFEPFWLPHPCTGIGLVLSNGPSIHSGWRWSKPPHCVRRGPRSRPVRAAHLQRGL